MTAFNNLPRLGFEHQTAETPAEHPHEREPSALGYELSISVAVLGGDPAWLLEEVQGTVVPEVRWVCIEVQHIVSMNSSCSEKLVLEER